MSEEVLIQQLSWLMILTGIIVFIVLKKGMTAGYGRYTNTARFGLSPQLAWFLQECPSFFIPLYFSTYSKTHAGLLLNILFCLHYFHRAFIFPFRLRSTTVSPLYIMASAIFFCCYNGYIQGAWNALYRDPYMNPFALVIGVFTFFTGMRLNHKADQILMNLRKPGETGYKIPKGFLYEYISCPNYFGEIVEWIGYAIAAQSLPAVAFAIFTICNIGPRAFSHHAWYKEKFPEYPKNRKALIPFFI